MSDDTLRERLAETLAVCTCTPYPYGDGPQIDCPRHGHEKYQADALLPVVREHVEQAVNSASLRSRQDERESNKAATAQIQQWYKQAEIAVAEQEERAETAEAAIERVRAVLGDAHEVIDRGGIRREPCIPADRVRAALDGGETP